MLWMCQVTHRRMKKTTADFLEAEEEYHPELALKARILMEVDGQTLYHAAHPAGGGIHLRQLGG